MYIGKYRKNICSYIRVYLEPRLQKWGGTRRRGPLDRAPEACPPAQDNKHPPNGATNGSTAPTTDS